MTRQQPMEILYFKISPLQPCPNISGQKVMADGSRFSLSLGAAKPSHSHHHRSHHRHSNGTKRPHSALRDSDDEDDEGRHQEITLFDKSAGGAVNSETRVQEKKPLIIPLGENSRKRQKSGLPSQNTEAAEAAAAEAKAKAKPTTYGLNVSRKEESTGADPSDAPKPDDAAPETRPKQSADKDVHQNDLQPTSDAHANFGTACAGSM